MSDDGMKPPRLEKIDWMKPLIHKHGIPATYVTTAPVGRFPHVVAIELSPGDIVFDGFDEYGRGHDTRAVVLRNAPEPEELQNGLWANINQDHAGNLYLNTCIYRTRADAEREAAPNHFKSIRLSTVPFISSGLSGGGSE